MSLQYYMRAFNTNLAQYVEWSVQNTPDLTGVFSGYPTNQLVGIVVNNIVNLTLDGYVFAFNTHVYWEGTGNTLVRSDTVDLTGAIISYSPTVASILMTQAQATSGIGKNITIEAQQAFAGSVGGTLALRAGKGGTPGTNLAGGITLDLGQTVSGSTSELRLEGGTGNRIGGISSSSNILQLSNDTTNTTGGISLNSTGYIQHIGGYVTFSAISPAALGASSTNNDYNPAGLATAQHLRVSLTGATATITGLVPPNAATQITIFNTDTVSPLILSNQNVLSAAANRFICPDNTDCTIPASGGVVVWYDSTVSRWRFLSSNSSVSLQGNRITGIAGRQTTVDISDQISTVVFDPSFYVSAPTGHTRSVKLNAILECTVAGQTCSLEFFNITDAATVTTLSTTNTTPTLVTSATLAIGNGAGELPNSSKMYGFRLTRTAGSTNDKVTCTQAYLEISYI